MTHDELVSRIDEMDNSCGVVHLAVEALRGVINLHREVIWDYAHCGYCRVTYPCETITELIEGLRNNEW